MERCNDVSSPSLWADEPLVQAAAGARLPLSCHHVISAVRMPTPGREVATLVDRSDARSDAQGPAARPCNLIVGTYCDVFALERLRDWMTITASRNGVVSSKNFCKNRTHTDTVVRLPICSNPTITGSPYKYDSPLPEFKYRLDFAQSFIWEYPPSPASPADHIGSLALLALFPFFFFFSFTFFFSLSPLCLRQSARSV